jgi:hypothetical protein
MRFNYIAIVVLIAMCVWMTLAWWRFSGELLMFGAVFTGVLAISVVLIDRRKARARIP